MSELHISLLIGGITLVVLICGVNALRVLRVRKKIDQRFFHDYPDALLDIPKNQVRDGHRDRLEPTLTLNPTADESDVNSDDVVAVIRPVESEIVEQNKPPKADELSEETSSEHGETSQIDETSAEEMAGDAHQFSLFPENYAVPTPFGEEEKIDGLAVPAKSNDDEQQWALTATGLFEPTIDFIAEITLDAPYHFDVLPRFMTTRRYGIAGLTEQGHWQFAQALPEIRYTALQIGLQTVDRNGAISYQELDTFSQEMIEFAQHINGQVHFALSEQQLKWAEDLDHFCAEVDVLVNVHILLQKPVEGLILQKVLNDKGMNLAPDGAFHFFSEEGDSLYSILGENSTPFNERNLLQQITVLTMLFDVPRIKSGLVIFDTGLGLAKELIRQFGGDLVDDNQQILTASGIARIREQLVHIYSRMQERGIKPGDVLARRLFA